MTHNSTFSKSTYPSGTLENALLSVPYPILKVEGKELRITYANDALLEIWAKDNNILGQTIHQIQPELVGQSFSTSIRRVFETGETHTDPEAVVNLVKNGIPQTVYFDYLYTAIKSDSKEITGVIVICKDVTEQVLAKQKLRESEEKFRSMVSQAPFAEGEEQFRSLSDAIPQLAWMADKEGWIFWYNQRWYDYTGTTFEEMQGWGWEKVHHPEFKEGIIEFCKIAWPKGEPFELTFPLKRSDGEWRWFLTRAVPIFDSKGELSRWFGTNTDITEQREALELNKKLLDEMEFERNRFEAVVTQMPGAVVIGEAPSGKLIFANEKINEVWGHPMKASENIGEYIQWIGFHPDGSQYQGHEWPLARSIQFGEIVNDEDVDIIRGDGKPAILRLSSAPIRDNFGKIIAGVVISQDVTQLKQAIRGRDEFLSIASHELKTPLTTLSASIQMLMRVYEKEPEAKTVPQLINTSYKSAVKLATLVRELLNVSKIESGQLTLSKSTFKLAKLIDECCTHVRLEGTHELLIEGDLSLEVYADQQRIDQVVVNFVNNAVKYSPDSPEIRLLIEKNDNLAKVSVIDKGIGVEPDKLAHLFERYYRVDPSGVQYSGLGLGLYISSEIIKLHKGEVGVSSVLGQGSTFWFTIPIDGVV